MSTKYLNIGDMDTDYVDSDGNIVKNDDTKVVMVRSKLDLPLFFWLQSRNTCLYGWI